MFSGLRTIDIAGGGPCSEPAQPAAAESASETYAGPGEVFAVSEVSALFAEHWRPLRVKSRRLFTWDDGRNQNLIVMGAPCVTPVIQDLPAIERYRVTAARASPLAGAVIEDLEAAPGQTREYGNSGTPLAIDHAVVMLVRLSAGRQFLFLAGTTTLGTQGAADFVCRDDSVQTLLDKIAALHRDFAGIQGFGALLSVTIRSGVPVQSQVVGLHIRRPLPPN